MTWNSWLAVGAVNGLVSVAAGAFGAHALKGKLDDRALAIFETASRYQMYHALALLAVAWLASRSADATVTAAGWLFLFGMILFSGSLYALAVTGVSKLGAITPVGGACMIAGWLMLCISAIRAPGLSDGIRL